LKPTLPHGFHVQRAAWKARCTCHLRRPAQPVQHEYLPHEVSSFVGRQTEIEAIANELRHARLVTLTGSGGVGKTRLALRVAGAASHDFTCCVWVGLSAVGEGARLGRAVAAAVQTGDPGIVEPLVATMRGQRLLLVLDNCEHVIEQCAGLAVRVLRECADVRILATSREPLAVIGEQVHPVLPLSVPAADDPADRQAETEAVQLFVERARARTARLELTPEAAALTARICRAVDGVPLSIELAAARTATMTLAEIARRLEDPLALLDGSGRAAPARQQSLRASLDWSHDLLSESERRLLRRLAIFGDGFTLDAAEAVCGDRDLLPADVARLLDRLVAQSLVLTEEHAGATRFRLTDPMRQYGIERLEQAGELASLQERHRAWCLDPIEPARLWPLGPDPQTGEGLVASVLTASPAGLVRNRERSVVMLDPRAALESEDPMTPKTRTRRPSVLSERERHVAVLVANGRSNREIAEELVITKKTAEAHVSHILTKLGLGSRVQIATWSLQNGLGAAADDLAVGLTG
jgi:predicted ATPase/DNA-binding CsgD family transcriptional regulator